jgi:hypothetical protein
MCPTIAFFFYAVAALNPSAVGVCRARATPSWAGGCSTVYVVGGNIRPKRAVAWCLEIWNQTWGNETKFGLADGDRRWENRSTGIKTPPGDCRSTQSPPRIIKTDRLMVSPPLSPAIDALLRAATTLFPSSPSPFLASPPSRLSSS